MDIDNIYTSIACNRHPTCLDYNESKGVVFGANHGIAYFQLGNNTNTLKTFVKHKSTVLSVKWVENCERKVFVSGSNDRNVIVWDISDKTTRTCVLEGHKGNYIYRFSKYTMNNLFRSSYHSRSRIYRK